MSDTPTGRVTAGKSQRPVDVLGTPAHFVSPHSSLHSVSPVSTKSVRSAPVSSQKPANAPPTHFVLGSSRFGVASSCRAFPPPLPPARLTDLSQPAAVAESVVEEEAVYEITAPGTKYAIASSQETRFKQELEVIWTALHGYADSFKSKLKKDLQKQKSFSALHPIAAIQCLVEALRRLTNNLSEHAKEINFAARLEAVADLIEQLEILLGGVHDPGHLLQEAQRTIAALTKTINEQIARCHQQLQMQALTSNSSSSVASHATQLNLSGDSADEDIISQARASSSKPLSAMFSPKKISPLHSGQSISFSVPVADASPQINWSTAAQQMIDRGDDIVAAFKTDVFVRARSRADQFSLLRQILIALIRKDERKQFTKVLDYYFGVDCSMPIHERTQFGRELLSQVETVARSFEREIKLDQLNKIITAIEGHFPGLNDQELDQAQRIVAEQKSREPTFLQRVFSVRKSLGDD